MKNIYSRYSIQTHFKGNSTIKNLLVFPPRTRTPWKTKVGLSTGSNVGTLHVIRYTWETSRTFAERLKKHLKEPSPIHNHSNNTGHATTQDNFQIVGREDHGIVRTIKVSIYIRVNNPTLNINIDKFTLHHIWQRVLLNTPGLQIKRHSHDTGHFQSTQLNSPCNFSQVLWSMLREHPYLSMHREPPRTSTRHWFSVLLQTW